MEIVQCLTTFYWQGEKFSLYFWHNLVTFVLEMHKFLASDLKILHHDS